MAGIRGEPIRGGTRGGQGDFKWTDVAADKDRENYLGHSVYAAAGRWQKNKDINWYNKDKNGDDGEARRAEIKKLKELEADALGVALGFAPVHRPAEPEKTEAELELERIEKEQEKLEKRARKEGKRRAKEERRQEKEARKLEKRSRHRDDSPERHRDRKAGSDSRSRSRSRSPARDKDSDAGRRRSRRERDGSREPRRRSRSPPRHRPAREDDRHRGEAYCGLREERDRR